MTRGHNGCLEREWLDRGRLPCVTERDVGAEGSEARLQTVPAYPCDIPQAGIATGEGSSRPTGLLKMTERRHETTVQSCQCGTSFDRHPDGSAALPGACDPERERLMAPQYTSNAVECSIKIFQVDKQLYQGNVRQVSGIKTKPSRLPRRQTRAQFSRSLTNVGRWQNGYVECE